MSKNKKQEQIIDDTPAPVQMKDCHLMLHKRAHHLLIVPTPLTTKQLESSDLYSNVATRMSPRDRVDVESVDGTMWAVGWVESKTQNMVKVKIREVFNMGDVIQEEINFMGFLIRLNAAHSTWNITNEKSGEQLSEGLPSQEAAVNYLQDYFKSNK